MPVSRRYAAVVGADNRVWFFGDITQIESYAPPADWRNEGQMPMRQGVAAALSGNTIYVMTGEGGTTNDAFNTTTKTFTPKRASTTGRTDAKAVAAPDGRIYLIAGNNAGTARLVEAYTPATDTWTNVATLQGDHGNTAAVIGPDNRLYVISGENFSGGDLYLPRVEIYGPSINLNPASGPRGTRIIVTGGNFASQTAVKVYWGDPKAGGVVIGTGATALSGNLPMIMVNIPATGTGPLFVVDAKSEYPAKGVFTIQ